MINTSWRSESSNIGLVILDMLLFKHIQISFNLKKKIINLLFPHINTHKFVVINVTNMVELKDRMLMSWDPSSISGVAELVL